LGLAMRLTSTDNIFVIAVGYAIFFYFDCQGSNIDEVSVNRRARICLVDGTKKSSS
jgi:hypothetical protein